jgi:hypothetical protein
MVAKVSFAAFYHTVETLWYIRRVYGMRQVVFADFAWKTTKWIEKLMSCFPWLWGVDDLAWI